MMSNIDKAYYIAANKVLTNIANRFYGLPTGDMFNIAADMMDDLYFDKPERLVKDSQKVAALVNIPNDDLNLEMSGERITKQDMKNMANFFKLVSSYYLKDCDQGACNACKMMTLFFQSMAMNSRLLVKAWIRTMMKEM